MVIFLPDLTGRFKERPHYEPGELDSLCEKLIKGFLRDLHGTVSFPVSTDDLTKLIERDASDLDSYADLSHYGERVEGVTEFQVGKKPSVKISSVLTEDERRKNRLRTTLSHEYGHVHLHRYLFDMEAASGNLFRKTNDNKIICKRETIAQARLTDWMEWQACYFSGALLMPLSNLKKMVAGFLKRHAIDAVAERTTSAEQLIEEVVQQFEVSSEAAKIRLLTLGLLATPDTHPQLFKQNLNRG